ncbi:very short patch repair endonuclease [Cohnella zeiphila]|nr:very short patch repair endonuclease [Cohnella zeiphila]
MNDISKQRSIMMGKVKGKNTKLEQSVSKVLWRKGFRYRKNVTSLFGKPDIAIKKYRVVIFIDSCFWHGCESHFKLPLKNPEYWNRKIQRNIARDSEVSSYYLNNIWILIRIWEHDLKTHFDLCIYFICKMTITSH